MPTQRVHGGAYRKTCTQDGTLLHTAARVGNPEIVRMLLEAMGHDAPKYIETKGGPVSEGSRVKL